MRKIIPFLILSLSVILTFCGCKNPLNYNSEVATTTTTTTEQTTVQGNSEVVTLARSSTVPTNTKEYVYHSDLLGATFVLPASWENRYAVSEEQNNTGGNSISFYEKDNHRVDEKLGELFTYNMFLNDKYKSGKNYTEYGTVTIDGTTYYLVCTTPTGTNYDKSNKNMKKAYDALNKTKDIQSICSSVVFDSGNSIDKNGCSTTMPTSTTDNSSSTTPTENNTANVTNTSGLVFLNITTEKLTSADLKGKSDDQIQTAINDICALNGYDFKTESIKKHYQQFSWYKPTSNYSESNFSAIEKYNYDFLQKAR